MAAGSRKLFTLTTVLVAVGTALVFGHFGLSVALGAFLAGMVVSESNYVSRMVDEITLMRDVFNSLFFVSLGMLVEPTVWISRPVASLGLVALIVIGKTALAGAAVWPVVRDLRLAAAAGLGLAQIGEFSLVVAAEAGRLGLVDAPAYDLILAIAVPTMILTPGRCNRPNDPSLFFFSPTEARGFCRGENGVGRPRRTAQPHQKLN